MAITTISRDWGSDPSIVRVVCDDSLATIVASGYLSGQADNIAALNMGDFDWRANDIVAVSYADDATGLFTVSADFADLVSGTLNVNGYTMLSGVTAAYGGGGTSNAFTVAGLLATDDVVANVKASSNAAALTTVVPTANTLTVGFTADPGAATTVTWVARREL